MSAAGQALAAGCAVLGAAMMVWLAARLVRAYWNDPQD